MVCFDQYQRTFTNTYRRTLVNFESIIDVTRTHVTGIGGPCFYFENLRNPVVANVEESSWRLPLRKD